MNSNVFTTAKLMLEAQRTGENFADSPLKRAIMAMQGLSIEQSVKDNTYLDGKRGERMSDKKKMRIEKRLQEIEGIKNA